MDSILVGNPSEHLLGKTLCDEWVAVEKIPIGKSKTIGTGGNFTIAYKVRRPDGSHAFLKALDYSRALSSRDVSRTLQAMTSAYLFECEVVTKCSTGNLDRIVRAVATGKIDIDEAGAKGPVEYIIFELADSDIRAHLHDFSQKFDLAWQLRSLHHIATGLKQLHTNRIVHQDLKPSNVLVFNGNVFKLGDLGRAAYQEHPIDHDDRDFAGDPAYAPLDLAYGFVLSEWSQRRLGCDAYHLGSMLVFFVSGISMTSLTLEHLDEAFRPLSLGGRWAGDFETVLPYVRVAFEEAVKEFNAQISDQALAGRLTRIVRELCEPDTRLRGHPLNRSVNGNSFSLERYISEFDLLAHRAESGFFK